MAIGALGLAGAEAGMNFLSGLIQGSMNYHHSKKLMAYQNQMNVENWKMQNQYNSPGAQMARLREAGLNPSLFYSNGQPSNTASPIQSAASPSMAGNVDFGSPGTSAVQTYLNTKMQQQQLKNMESQNDATTAEAKLKALQLALEYQKKPYYAEVAKQWMDSLLLDNLVKDSQVKNLESSTSQNMAATQNLYATFDQIKATTKNIDQDTVSKKIHSAVERALAESSIKLNSKQIELLAKNIESIGYSNGMAEIDLNIYKNIYGDGKGEGSWYDFFTKSLPTSLWYQFNRNSHFNFSGGMYDYNYNRNFNIIHD